MSELLEALRTAQPLPDHSRAAAHYDRQAALAACAASRPRLGAGFVRAQWVIDANTKRHTNPDTGDVKWHLVALEHEATIGELAALYNDAAGHSAAPSSGCRIAYLPFGPLRVAVEYEAEPEEGDGWNEPHYPASVAVLAVYLNGQWCRADDVATAEQIEAWQEQILDGVEA